MGDRLFPLDLPEREWLEFEAEGFSKPVAGVIHRGTNPPDCGVPLAKVVKAAAQRGQRLTKFLRVDAGAPGAKGIVASWDEIRTVVRR